MKQPQININTLLNVVTLAAIALMWFGSVSAHVDDKNIHNNYQKLSEKFVPRTELDIVVENLSDQIDRLEAAIEKLEIKIK